MCGVHKCGCVHVWCTCVDIHVCACVVYTWVCACVVDVCCDDKAYR